MIRTYHFHPELMSLLVDTIPVLFRSKSDLLLFFRGAGISSEFTEDLAEKVRTDRENINKYEIVRTVLARLNEKGETTLRERREVIKRVVEFEDFSTCWPTQQLKAKGLVGEIRRVVNVKDSFTRMQQEREAEREKRFAEQDTRIAQMQERKARLNSIKQDLFALFSDENPHARGKKLEGVLNRLFAAHGILVREAFALRTEDGRTIEEQIDGAVEIDGHIYLAELKWWDKPLGVGDVAQHLVRVFYRGHTRGIFISASRYTGPAIQSCKEALQKAVIVLCDLAEIVRLLECEADLKSFLKEKINASILDKNPFFEPLK